MSLNITKKITLNTNNYRSNDRIVIKQGCVDTITLIVTINDKGGVLELPAGTTAKIRMLKPDKKQVLNDCDVVNNSVHVNITEQMQAAAGDGYGEIILIDGEKIFTTVTFPITILPNVHDDSRIESTDEYQTLINAIIRIEGAQETAEAAYEVAQEANALLDMAESKLQGYDTAEEARSTAEQGRQSAEQARQQAETERQQAETDRVNAFNLFMDDISGQFEEKYNNLEEEYAEDLAWAKSGVEQLLDKVDLAIIDTQSGSFVQSTIADDCVTEVTIEGKTVVTPLDPTQDISPDNPATITSVGDDPFDVVSCGKNLLKVTATSRTENGVHITVNPDKSITINGTASAGVYIIIGYANLKAGNYIVSGGVGGGGSTYQMYIDGYAYGLPQGDKSISVAADSQIAVRIAIYSGVTANNLTFYPMVRRADVADPTYEPYKSNKITISSPLRNIPDSNTLGDTLEIFANKTAKYTKRVKQVVITGSSDVKYVVEQDTNNIRFQVQLENYNSSNASSVTIMLPAMSDKLKVMNVEGSSSLTANTFNVRQHRDWGGIRAVICIPKSYLSSYDVEGIKTWLNSNPITILYYFVTSINPAIEEIVPFDSVLMSYRGITNILTTDDLQPNITAKFLSRLGNFAKVIIAKLDKLTQALLALGGTV